MSILWQGKPWQAFKTFAIIFSFAVNIILLIVLLLIAPLILPIMTGVDVLVGGLTKSFVLMDDASIKQTIVVNDEIPIEFTLPLEQQTDVVLAEAVPLSVNAQFVLPNGGGTINGQVSLQLPKGTALPVLLDLDVPVKEDVPILLNVPVDIPLNKTELGEPFGELKGLFIPLDKLVKRLPTSNEDLGTRLMGEQAP